MEVLMIAFSELCTMATYKKEKELCTMAVRYHYEGMFWISLHFVKIAVSNFHS